jgi:hypothetical protein
VTHFRSWQTAGDLAIALGIVILALLIGNFIIDGGKVPDSEVWPIIVGLAAAAGLLVGGILANYRQTN